MGMIVERCGANIKFKIGEWKGWSVIQMGQISLLFSFLALWSPIGLL